MKLSDFEIDGLEERFWSKVDKTGGCWIWTGPKMHGGYGRVNLLLRGGKRKDLNDYGYLSAHRLAYELTYGEILDHLHICHKCDNPPCVLSLLKRAELALSSLPFQLYDLPAHR